MSRVVVMLESRYIPSREGREGGQTLFRALLKSSSAVGEGQQLLLRDRVLVAGAGVTGLQELSQAPAGTRKCH